MIARHGILLLIAGLMLLIDNHQPQVLERQQYGTACPKDDIIGMSGELFLPNLHPLGIGVLAVIDTQTIAKHMLQALHNLHRQRNFWQEIEHLLFLLQSLFDEVDIDLRLSAGSDTMQQRDILLHEGEKNLIIGILLDLVEGLDLLKVRFSPMIQTPHLQLVGLQQTPFHQSVNCLQRGMACVHQFITGDLHRRLATSLSIQRIPMRECQILDESLLLFTRPLEHIQRHMKRLFVAKVGCQADIKFCLRTIAVFCLQTRRKCGLIDFSYRRHIIIGDPIPEPQLTIK